MAPIDPSKRVALITGCSEPVSLGAAFARELVSRGWTVFASARKLSTLDPLADAGCEVLELDVASPESVAAAAQRVGALTGGRLDLLINNAGALGMASALRTDPDKLAAMHDIHVLGPLRLVQAFFPLLRETARRDAGERGKIINIGSILSNAYPWHTAYATTKAGTQVMSDIMRRELAPAGVDVTTVELGVVRTAMIGGTKEYPLEHDAVPHELYDTRAAIQAAGKDIADMGPSAPSPADIARYIVSAVTGCKRAPAKLYAGKNSWIFRWVLPYLPGWAVDAVYGKLGRMELVKQVK